MCFHIGKGCVAIIHVLRLEIWKRVVCDVRYAPFDIQKSYLRTVNVRDTRFYNQKDCVKTVKSCVWMLDVRYTPFDVRISYLRTVNVRDAFLQSERLCEDGRHFVQPFIH